MAVPRLAGRGRFGYNRSSRAHRGRLVFTPEVRRLVMRQISDHLLWLGNAGDERDCQRILDIGIRAVVQLAAEEPVLVLPRDLVYCHFPLVDGPGNDRKLLRLAITTVANLLEKNVPTLVVCGAGQSRSPVVAAAAIALVFQQPADECLKQVAEHFPADVAPALWDEVKKVVEEGVL